MIISSGGFWTFFKPIESPNHFKAALSSLAPPTCELRGRAGYKTVTKKVKRQEWPTIGNLSHLGEVLRKDLELLKEGISRGIGWANEAFRIPQVFKTLEDALWLRYLEDPRAPPPPLDPQPWPRPWYPELSGVDLLMADLKAVEAYASYYYHLSKVWSKPLPEGYDPHGVVDYFNCRPHIVALRLLEVFSAFAFATIKIQATGIKKFLSSSPDRETDWNISQYDFGMVLKETMLTMGPTFIKVGQSVSTRPDIIGTEISKALSELHDRIPPFPRTVAMKIIEEELGSPVESFFSYISEEPVAAASFGQVYRGNTHDGYDVAVKVQRPNLRHMVIRDIYILRLGLGLVQTIAKRKSDLRLYADELGKGLVGELDYSLEASNASKFLEAHASFSFMHVPKVFQHLSRKRVLTMEWVVGESPTDLLSISTSDTVHQGVAYSEIQKVKAKRRLLDLVNKGVEASLVQLLETGLLHADPHPGNLRYISTGQIGFLDFGLLCQMERKHRFAMLASIVHIVNGDWAALVRALVEMDVVRPGTNIHLVTMELEDALGEVKFKDGIPDVKFSKVLSKIWSMALKYHFRMPPYYTLVLRSLTSLEGLAVAADPYFKTFEAAYPFVVQKLLTENSAETRKILQSVVLNKRKELQWERLTSFLGLGLTRKVLNPVMTSTSEGSHDYLPSRSSDVFDVAYLILRLLPSRDGIGLRKLLVTADGASLIRAIVSKEGIFFRQQFCKVVSDVLYQWMAQTLGQGATTSHCGSQGNLNKGPESREPNPPSGPSIFLYDCQSILSNRRLKVTVLMILESARKDPVLMLKFCWTYFVVFAMAAAMACYRVLVSLSKSYIRRLHLSSLESGC